MAQEPLIRKRAIAAADNVCTGPIYVYDKLRAYQSRPTDNKIRLNSSHANRWAIGMAGCIWH